MSWNLYLWDWEFLKFILSLINVLFSETQTLSILSIAASHLILDCAVIYQFQNNFLLIDVKLELRRTAVFSIFSRVTDMKGESFHNN